MDHDGTNPNSGTPGEPTGLEIAVIGLACRFPGAADSAEYWRNISSGTESITVHSREALGAAGLPEALLDDPDFVPAAGVLEGSELFDAEFFGINPKEADLMDPQHRILLECSWSALEDAGYDPKAAPGPVGVYVGSYYNSYLANLVVGADPMDAAEEFARNLANEKDYLATRIAYKLDLSGPAMTVQTACSTSLVAVHLACQALLSGACDTAIAGGATVRAKQLGYVYQPGGIFSADGHCRPFDAMAQGTVASNGAGVVVLRRLEDALADGDPIRAVIKGSAVGNDAAQRVGFTAPGAAGQARVIAAALEMAEVDPGTVSYVETHGSGTPVGDPIEVEALTRVFKGAGTASGGCAIGAVKSNIGHTHAASGVAGLIKTVLALQNRQLPPSLHFDKPNQDIDFEATPFYVNTRLKPWPANGGPRRAGVSSFGMGGTDAHVVLEEAPQARSAAGTGRRQLIPISARTEAALEIATDRLAEHLEQDDVGLEAIARTLQSGRHHFSHRRFVTATDPAATAQALRERDPRVMRGARNAGPAPSVTFLLPGLGEQRPGMGRELYTAEPVFRSAIDRCAEILQPVLGLDLRTLLHPVQGAESVGNGRPDLRRMLGRETARAAGERNELDRTLYAQPATFALEYALGVLWQSWGVRPDALIGYSIGEYAAACLAGVLTLEDALLLVAHRARLIEELPGGAMLAVPLPEDRVRALLGDRLSLAAINGSELCVVAGETDRISELEERLRGEETATRRLRTTHAFHSHMMAPIVERFTELVAGIRLSPPSIPYVSNVTGTWITPEQATDPVFWSRHLRQEVRFGDGVARLWQDPDRLFLEIGPGQSLSSLALQARPSSGGSRPASARTFASMPGEYDRQSEHAFLLTTAGKLWTSGLRLDWSALRGGAEPARVSLPGSVFERRRHWIEPASRTPSSPAPSLKKKPDITDWFTVPVWEPLAPHPAGVPVEAEHSDWLLFQDEQGVGAALAVLLTEAGHRVTTVRAGVRWNRVSEGAYEIDPSADSDYLTLISDLDGQGRLPVHIVHLWAVGPREDLDRMIERGFASLLRLNRAMVGSTVDIAAISSDAHAVLGSEDVAPERAMLTGPALVLPLEQPETGCRVIDISLPTGSAPHPGQVKQVLAELLHPSGYALTALRGRGRWTQSHRPVRLPAETGRTALRHRGVYLITGGFGGVGLALARHLAETVAARLVLVGRGGLPPRDSWDRWLADHPAEDRDCVRIRAVLELEELGGEVLAMTADVTDASAMHEIADEAVLRFGEVHGIVHAAGVPAAGLAQLKDMAEAEKVLAPKVRGGLVVNELARRLDPDFTVLCSSTLALTGGVGQIDYVAANAFLDALAQYNDASGGPATVSVNWDGWQEVGMAARLIGGTDDQHGRVGPIEHPLLERCLADDGNRAVYSVSLSVATSWLIDEHRMAGSAVVPGTGHLELVRAVHEHQSGEVGVELGEVTFLSPVVFGENQRRELRVVLEKASTPTRFAVVSRNVDDPAAVLADEGWQVHVTGEVGPLDRSGSEPRRYDVDGLIAAAGMRDLGAIEHRGPMGFGPRSRCLRRVHLGEHEALAELELPEEFSGDLEQISLHPSLLDLAAGFHGMNLAQEFRIPLTYGRLSLLAPLPRRIFSHHRFREADHPGKETFTADFTLLDEDGRELARIEGFVLKRVVDLESRLNALRDGTFAEVAPYRFPAADPTAPGSSAGLLKHLEQGIRPEEGVEALLRVLGSDLGPRMAIVAKDLDAVLADIKRGRLGDNSAEGQEPPDAGAHPRPDVTTAYAVPRDAVERRLAELWAGLLGLSEVGVHDNFFELGGHSLLGVQLVTRIRRQLGVDLPLSALFETLTIAEFANVLRPRLAEAVTLEIP